MTVYGNFPHRIPIELHRMLIGFIVVTESVLEKSLIMSIFNINNSHHIIIFTCICDIMFTSHILCLNDIKLSIGDHMEHKNMNCMFIF